MDLEVEMEGVCQENIMSMENISLIGQTVISVTLICLSLESKPQINAVLTLSV